MLLRGVVGHIGIYLRVERLLTWFFTLDLWSAYTVCIILSLEVGSWHDSIALHLQSHISNFLLIDRSACFPHIHDSERLYNVDHVMLDLEF